jgi:serine protease Do
MKIRNIATIAASVLLPLAGFSQAPPNPPNPPGPPAAPNPTGPPEKREKPPKVPVTFLGVETSPVPPVVCEQLALAKGFGLVVDYVVPDSPAAAAGIQQNDILKLLNDQILTEPDQLSKLVRSYSEGTNITLTVLRKGQEQKITVKLTKKDVPQRRAFGRRGRDFGLGDMDFGDIRDQMNELKDQLGDANQGMIHDAVMKAHEQVQRVREQAERAREEAERLRDKARDEAERAREKAQEERERTREEVRRAGQEVKITRSDDTGLKTTTIDLGKAQIVCSDDKGELRIDNADGKRMLTAKDPKGMLLFSGPVETKEDIDKIPAAVRERFDKLQQNDLPSVVAPNENDDEDNSGDIDDENDETPSAEQICISPQLLSRGLWAFRTILI